VEIPPTDDGFFVRATQKEGRKRYTLEELLAGQTEEYAEELKTQTAWAREGRAVGRELA
jgi:hypothetical protein